MRPTAQAAPRHIVARIFAWCIVGTTFAFILNNFLTFWLDWPGARLIFSGTASGLAWLQAMLFLLGLLAPVAYVWTARDRTARFDSNAMTKIAAYIVRAAFWVVLLIGLADMAISFVRVEGLLDSILGAELGQSLGRSRFRGPYVHVPLIAISLIIAAFTRTLGFTWLALLVVIAELQIVLARFIFSYEQAFMGDLVRFWYAALFLFASAYTLLEDGHVRVDVLYSGFSERKKGLVNAVGSILLGVTFCWVILIIGFEGKSSIINGPLLNFEISQSGFGMYVKYLMAGFLGVFGVSMMIQFAAMFLDGVSDFHGEAGHRESHPGMAT